MSYKTVFQICALVLSSAVVCYTCNQAVCGSIVSKCLITESCKCDLKTCNCCKECFLCLSYLYDECCSCVDLCPKPNASRNPLSSKSHVEDLNEPVPGLFQALTMDPDPQERWRSFSFPVDFDVSFFNAKTETKFQLQSDATIATSNSQQSDVVTLNCTVAYLAQCGSWNKCQATCQSMGATSYRWFHDGCCECIGDTCINYGINESRCTLCKRLQEQAADEFRSMEYDDYGDDELDLADDYV